MDTDSGQIPNDHLDVSSFEDGTQLRILAVLALAIQIEITSGEAQPPYWDP